MLIIRVRFVVVCLCYVSGSLSLFFCRSLGVVCSCFLHGGVEIGAQIVSVFLNQGSLLIVPALIRKFRQGNRKERIMRFFFHWERSEREERKQVS